MKFLRNFLAAILALIVFTGFFVLILVAALMDDGVVVVEENSILHVSMNLPVTEREIENPFDGIPISPGPASSIGLIEFRETLLQAAKDPNIKGVLLDLDNLQAGIGSVEELRNTLLEYKESGKFLFANARYYSEPAYYLASVADEIYMHPEGDLEFNGLAANVMFFKKTFEKLEIEPQIFRVGDFKSAVEPFIREDMSEENKLQYEALLGSVNGHLLENVSISRGINLDSVRNMNDHYLIRTADDALAFGMVDHLKYRDELLADLKEQSGLDQEEDSPGLISYSKYRESYVPDYSGRNKIAMIVASGEIVGGKGDFATIGSEKFTKEIRKAREDESIKAIVLRINSPGGSFLASDEIWREVKLAAEIKPVVASMGDAAASGGYYMAMACDTIVANPTTITGSIGVFSMLFNIEDFLDNKLGITTDVVTTGEFSDMYSADRPVTEQERAIIQRGVESSYATFIAKAAEGRNMSEEAIGKIASGRVWTGRMAKDLGLVDVLGDAHDAILIAAEMANISDDYRVRYSPPQENILDMLFGGNQSQMRSKMAREELGTMYRYVEQVKKLERLQGIQARSMYELEIY